MNDLELDYFLRNGDPLESRFSERFTNPPVGTNGQQTESDLERVFIYDAARKANSLNSPDVPGNVANFINSGSTTPPYIKISKNFRYKEVPYHSHAFLEMNYLYSGECINTINDKEYKMAPGDFVIMDTKCVHKLERAGENDLLINILILPEFAESAFMEMLTGDSILSAFLVNAVYRLTSQPNHIYFKAGDSTDLQNAIRRLLREYFDPNAAGSNILINCYVREIFALLMRECIDHLSNVVTAYEPNSKVSQIVNFIKLNCKTCTRETTAKIFGYNANHLSQMLVHHTSKSFMQIRNEFRLNSIESMFNTTRLSVKELADEYGFTNTTHFYKLYKEYFKKYPRDTASL